MTDLDKIVNDVIENRNKKKEGTTMKRSGPGLCSMLFLVFLVLKLTNTITWSWWWVTAPLWMPLALTIGIVLFVFIIAIMCHILFGE